MSFKIVKTIENEKPELSVVPEAWEQEGFLYWPSKFCKDGEKLSRDPESVPRKDWHKIPCVVKEADIESLKTANKLCSLYTNLPDTDAEVE